MAYCTVEHVQSLLRAIIFTDSTKVTLDDITNIHIPAADAIIDSRLRNLYAVPITNVADLKLIRHISMNLAAGIVAEILFETTNNPNENNPARQRYDRAMALLEGLVAGEQSLATGKSNATIIWSRVEELYEEQDQDMLEPSVMITKEF